MRNALLALFALCMVSAGHAQLTVNPQLPPVGVLRQDQLWNLILVNNDPSLGAVTLTLSLREAATGRPVLNATSSPVLMGAGVRVLRAADFQPIQYDYMAAGIGNAYLPAGRYTLCYRALPEKTAPAAETCLPLQVDPLSPPILHLPADTSTVVTTSPQFVWVPPTPAEMLPDLVYQLQLTGVEEGQSPAQAMQRNLPLYTGAYLRVPFHAYPAAYQRLERGKTYAWQVVAQSGTGYTMATPVWSFRVSNDSLPTPPRGAYLELRPEADRAGTSTVSGDRLLLKLYSYEPAYKGALQVFDGTGRLVWSTEQPIAYGNNFIDLPLKRRFQPGVSYVLRLLTPAGETLQLSFRVTEETKQP